MVLFYCMRVSHILLLSILTYFVSTQECPIAQYFKFYVKQIDKPFPIIDNPY